MGEYLLNIDRDKIDSEKRAFLDEFDNILDKNRSNEARELQKQIGYLDVNDLFKSFTI